LENPLCFTRSEAAERLKVSPPTVDKLIREGKLSAFRIGEKNVRIPGWSLEKYIQDEDTR
jgi:excisionase family DNA binding protein